LGLRDPFLCHALGQHSRKMPRADAGHYDATAEKRRRWPATIAQKHARLYDEYGIEPSEANYNNLIIASVADRRDHAR